MGYSLWVVALHAAGVISAVSFCKPNIAALLTSTRDDYNSSKVIDFLPASLLEVEVGPVLRWLSSVLAFAYGVFIICKVHHAFFGLTSIINIPGVRDVGYLMTPGMTRKDIANMVRRRRKVGDLPPSYPNGWYEIMLSRDLPVGASRAVSLLGQHFAVFRRENGHVSVMDAYCPHLGANLGVGGQVRGNCIECPFHGWQFDGDTGQCTAIPYAAKVPSFAKTKVWQSLEINGVIFMWYDVDGKDPWYYPEDLLGNKKNWMYKGFTFHLINAHCQDLSENGADVSHLKIVHEVGVQSGKSTNYKSNTFLGSLLVHDWKVNWEPLPSPNGHIGRMSISLSNKLFGRWPLKFLDVNVVADQIGPSIVHLKFNMFLGRGVWIHTTVPEEPLLQRMTHYLYCDWWIPTFLANWVLLSGESVQIERDAIIWDNKTYVSKPLFVKEDGRIVAHRRWFSQFYSENSVRVSAVKKDESEW